MFTFSISTFERMLLTIHLWAFVFFKGTFAGEFCGGTYCEDGCCDYDDEECCSNAIGLIVGLCVAAAVAIFVIVIIICVCRRRRYRGHVWQNNPGQTIVVSQGLTTTNQGAVNTAGMPPGSVVYPPYQPYNPQPYIPSQQFALPIQNYAPQVNIQQYAGQPVSAPAYTQAPPSYDTLGYPAASAPPNNGVDNPAFAHGKQ